MCVHEILYSAMSAAHVM